VIPHSDPNIREVDDKVFINIRKSFLHYVARGHLLCLHLEAIEWIIDHTDLKKSMIMNDASQCMGSFLAVKNLERYYKIPKLEVHLVNLFVDEFYQKHDENKILASWWKEDKRFFHK
jgi:hypothetical protein